MSDLDALKKASAMTALNVMMASSYFCISTIDKVAKLLGVDPKGEAYNILSPLHCIDFAKMPDELREAIPGLIEKCLGVEPVYQFSSLERGRIVEVNPAPSRTGLMRLLGRS